MADFLATEERSSLMRRVRSEGTGAEEALVEALRRVRLKPERHADDLPGRPDFVFRRARLVVFIDGDYWHGNQWRLRGHDFLDQQFSDARDRGRWIAKIQGNVRRDIKQTDELLQLGWRVLRFWESEVLDDGLLGDVVERVRRAIRNEERPASKWIASVGSSAEFFAGIGLMRLGLKETGWRTTWANDYDAKKRRLYLHNLGDEQVELEGRSILDIGAHEVPQVGTITACFPCTDLSLAGKARGIVAGPQSSTYLRFADILEGLGSKRPAFVILENVLGLIHSHAGTDFELCLSRLADAGYTVDALALDARRFVPQSRPRMFIVGVRKQVSVEPALVDTSTLEASPLRPERLVAFIREHPELPWRIRPLPDPPVNERRLIDILDDFDPGSAAWWSADRVSKLRGQTPDRHKLQLRELVAELGVAHVTAFRRMREGRSTLELRFDGIAGCLRTPKGGSAKQILVRADEHGWKARYLSATECARLMGADGFRIDAEGLSENDALFGFGDAVCVPAVTWLADNYINPIAASLIRGRLLAR